MIKSKKIQRIKDYIMHEAQHNPFLILYRIYNLLSQHILNLIQIPVIGSRSDAKQMR